LKYIQPKKLKIIMGLFFATGVWGMVYGTGIYGLAYGAVIHQNFLIVLFGTINFCLGGLFGYRLLTQEKTSLENSKKKRRHN
jgi:glucose uptake protein GlcU